MEKIIAESKQIEKKLIDMRRELHMYPEIGGELPETREYVCKCLDEIGIPYQLNSSDSGIVAEIKGKNKGKTIAFRADMDGLHIDEDTGLPFKSKIQGQMHGCGHDAHTAMLIAAAEIINNHKSELNGNVRLIFEAGEETGDGAQRMIDEGRMNGVDAICSIHVGNLAGDDHKAGKIVVLPGPASAGKAKFTITVHGKGTHSAFPEKGVDPILVAARIVNASEEMFARELSAGTVAVLTFGSFQAGIDHNSIPAEAVIKGSMRFHDENVYKFLSERLKEISENIAKAFRAECSVEIRKGSPAVVNDEQLSKEVAEAASCVIGNENVITKISTPLMASDDFSKYSAIVPGVYFFLCTNNAEKGICVANHNPKFDVDESVLWEGAASYAAIAMRYLK